MKMSAYGDINDCRRTPTLTQCRRTPTSMIVGVRRHCEAALDVDRGSARRAGLGGPRGWNQGPFGGKDFKAFFQTGPLIVVAMTIDRAGGALDGADLSSLVGPVLGRGWTSR